MRAEVVSRAALLRVMKSLITHELARSRGRRTPSEPALRYAAQAWDEETLLSGDGEDEFGCDSLELLQLAAAANEMFHLHEAGRESDLLASGRLGHWLDQVMGAWAAGVSQLTFATSGSTGSPKSCSHAVAHLGMEANFLAARFEDRRRVVTFAPPHHIYGFLFCAMLPDRLGAEVWTAECTAPNELASALRPGDLVVAFPERWAWLHRSLPSWPENVIGVTSTAPCPAALIGSLSGRGLAGMVEVYGSSETAGIGLRICPDHPFTMMPHWRRRLESEERGDELIHRSGWQVRLPDDVLWTGDRQFDLNGRTDGAVHVGGVNVFPQHVADRLRQCPGVAEIKVRLMRSEEGPRLKAFVVPRAGTHDVELERGLRVFAAKHLPAVERPTAFTFGTLLPTSEMGKPADW